MSTARNSVYVIAAQVSLLFSGAVINFFLGRHLGPELYGQFGLVYAVATIINLLLTPGLLQSVSKFVAESPSDAASVAKSMLKKQLLAGMVLGFAYFIVAVPLAAALKDSSLAVLLMVQSPLVLIYALSSVYAGYLAGLGRFGRNAAELLIYSSSRLAFTVILAYFFSLAGAVIALPLAAFVGLIYFYFAARFSSSSPASTRRIYAFAVPTTAFIGLVALFINADLFLVKVLLQDNVLVGYYTAAGVIARIPYFVLSALGVVMLPIVSGKLSSGQSTNKFVQDAFRYVLIVLLPSAAVMVATAKPLVMLLYRSEYAAAAIPLAILAVGAAALTLSYLFGIVINAAGRPALSAAVAAGVLALGIALNTALIPKYGLAGAAFATALSSFVGLAVTYAAVYAKVGNPVNYASFVRVVLASIIVFAIAVQFELQNKFLLPLLYLGLGIVYMAALFVLGELKKEDFRRIAGLAPGRFF